MTSDPSKSTSCCRYISVAIFLPSLLARKDAFRFTGYYWGMYTLYTNMTISDVDIGSYASSYKVTQPK